jgi:HK97 family phage prohead protease
MHRSGAIVGFKALAEDDADGTFEAYVSVFNNVDSAKEVVMPGAFAKSLANKLPKIAWGHNWEEIIGSVKEAQEHAPGDPRLPIQLAQLGGLWIKGKLNLAVAKAAEAYALLKDGDVTEFSIGYRVMRAHRVTEEGEEVDDTLGYGFFGRGKSVRYLDELELYEVSPVLAGANDRTMLVGVKSDMALGDQIDVVMEAFKQIYAEAADLLERRVKEGRTFSAANFAKLEGYASSLDEVAKGMRDLLASAKRESDADKGETLEPKPEEKLDYTDVVLKEIALAEIRKARFQRTLMTV